MISINQKEYLLINGSPVDVNVSFQTGVVNLIKGANGVGKTSFVKKIAKSNSDISVCFQKELRSLNTILVKDLLDCLKETRSFDFKACKELLSVFDFEKNLNKEVNILSGGENQTLKLIINLSSFKKNLIFDEPSQFLDSQKLGQFIQRINDIKEDKLIILIEHNSSYLENTDLNVIKFINEGASTRVCND